MRGRGLRSECVGPTMREVLQALKMQVYQLPADTRPSRERVMQRGKEGMDKSHKEELMGTRKPAGSREWVKRIQKWPPKKVHPGNKPNEVSPEGVVEEMFSVNSEEALSFVKVDSRANTNIPPEDPQDELAGTRADVITSMSKVVSGVKRKEWIYSIQYPSSDEEEDPPGHLVTIIALVHAEAGFSDEE
nr:uncharacterized protein LOC105870976 isoform X2 [Microcebus murinus]